MHIVHAVAREYLDTDIKLFWGESEESEKNMEKLKPCPFCGGKAIIKRFANPKHWYCVECEDCHCRTDGFVHNRREASDAENKEANAVVWNRRVN